MGHEASSAAIEEGDTWMRVLSQPSSGTPFTTYQIHWIDKKKYRCPGRDDCPACSYCRRFWQSGQAVGNPDTARSMKPFTRNDFQAVLRRDPTKVQVLVLGDAVVTQMLRHAILFKENFHPSNISWVLRPAPGYSESIDFLQGLTDLSDQTGMFAYADWLRERDFVDHADAVQYAEEIARLQPGTRLRLLRKRLVKLLPRVWPGGPTPFCLWAGVDINIVKTFVSTGGQRYPHYHVSPSSEYNSRFAEPTALGRLKAVDLPGMPISTPAEILQAMEAADISLLV